MNTQRSKLIDSFAACYARFGLAQSEPSRLHFDKFVSLDPPRINPYAFKPQVTGRSPDNTGISFYRQACVVVHHDILVKTDVAKRQKYGIVRVPIAFLSSLELHVHRDDDVEPPIILGHVVLPGINSENYVADKESIANWGLEEVHEISYPNQAEECKAIGCVCHLVVAIFPTRDRQGRESGNGIVGLGVSIDLISPGLAATLDQHFSSALWRLLQIEKGNAKSLEEVAQRSVPPSETSQLIEQLLSRMKKLRPSNE